MSIIYRSSLLFSRPSNYTISHMQIQDVLYNHKKKLQINQRSTSKDDNYKTQRLLARQAKTIQNLSQKTRTYSLNKLLKTYHQKHQHDINFEKQTKNTVKRANPQKNYYQTIDVNKQQQDSVICPQKLKLFKAGVNYRSNQRARGAGVKKINIEDLKTYFERCPEEEIQFKLNSKKPIINKISTIDYHQTSRISQPSSFKFNRIESYKSCVK